MGIDAKDWERVTVFVADELIEVYLGVTPPAVFVLKDPLEHGALDAEVLGLLEHIVHHGYDEEA